MIRTVLMTDDEGNPTVIAYSYTDLDIAERARAEEAFRRGYEDDDDLYELEHLVPMTKRRGWVWWLLRRLFN